MIEPTSSSSLQDIKFSPNYIATQIRMLRTDKQYSGSFLIAEGDTDARLWKNLVDSTKCRVENASGKDNAIAVLNILEKDNFAGVLAVVDADIDILEKNLPLTPNLLLTDTHDLETMLLKSPALEKVVTEHGSAEKIESFAQDIRETLLQSAKIIGYLRCASLKFNYCLKFEGLKFKKFVDDRTLILDESKLIKIVKDNSEKPGLDEQEIRANMDSLKTDTQDMWHVCCGHDMISILSIAFGKALASFSSQTANPNVLEQYLRVAYESSYFCTTQLYAAIQHWEKNNQPFQVLPNP